MGTPRGEGARVLKERRRVLEGQTGAGGFLLPIMLSNGTPALEEHAPQPGTFRAHVPRNSGRSSGAGRAGQAGGSVPFFHPSIRGS